MDGTIVHPVRLLLAGGMCICTRCGLRAPAPGSPSDSWYDAAYRGAAIARYQAKRKQLRPTHLLCEPRDPPNGGKR